MEFDSFTFVFLVLPYMELYTSLSFQGSIAFICCFVLMILLVVAIFFAIWGWWIGDAVIFGLNKRSAGDGCPLNGNL